MADPFDFAVNYYQQNLGLTPDQARGAVRWMQRIESGLNPAAFNPAGGGQGALGIAQWRGPRQQSLISQYGRSPSLEQQLAFSVSEMQGPYAHALQALKSTGTEPEAFRAFGKHYEVPSPAEYAKATGGYSSGLRARPGPREGYYDDALHVTLRPREPEGIPLALLDELLGKSSQGEEKQQSPLELLDSLLGQTRPEEAKRVPATGEGDFIEPPGPVAQPETVIGTEPLKPTEMKPLADLPKPPGADKGQAIDPQTVSRSDFIEPLGAGQETPSLVPPTASAQSPEGVLDMLLRQASSMKPDLGQIGEQAMQGGADILQGLGGLAERARLGAMNTLRMPGTQPRMGETPMGPGLRAGEGAITAATGGLLSPLATPVRGAGQIARGVSRETSAAIPAMLRDTSGALRVAARDRGTGQVWVGKPGQIHADLVENPANAEMGFADEAGNFLTREEAFASLSPETQGRLRVRGELDAADYEMRGGVPRQYPATEDPMALMQRGELTAERATQTSGQLKAHFESVENEIFGEEQAKELRRLHRQSNAAWNRADDARARELDARIAEIESKASDADMRHLEGRDASDHIDPEGWRDLARELRDVEGSREGALGVVARQLRNLPAGEPRTLADREAIAIIGRAIQAEEARGGDVATFLKDAAQERFDRYGGGHDAAELLRDQLQRLRRLMDAPAAPATEQGRLPPPSVAQGRLGPPSPPSGAAPPGGGGQPPEPPRPPSGPTGGGEAPRGGRASKAVASFKEVVNAAIRDAQIKGVPMAAGDDAGRAIAKDYANAERLARYRRMRWDKELRKLSPEDQRAMWEAMDNASVAAQQYGYEAGLRYLQTLPREQRALLAEMERDGIRLWENARDAGLVAENAERLPFYIMRGVVEIGEDGSISRIVPRQGPGLSALDQFGVNLTTQGPRQREHLTAEQTEAAARHRFGEDAEIVRNIRVLPMAYERFERAIAGRRLINDLKEIGEATGKPTVAEGEQLGSQWFTVEHPSFNTYRPRYTKNAEGNVVPVRDQNGKVVMDRVPLYVSREFEGPLRAVMRHETDALYNAAMMVKAGAMASIMNSPVIHNMVEWGRALGAMPGRVATFKVYRIGSEVLQKKAVMEKAIRDGLVPIGDRGYLTDIEGIASASDLQPGRGMLAKGLGWATDIVSPQAGETVRRGIDRAGDFWHQKLLWDQVAKLQAGLYNEFALDMVKRGVDRDVASKIAAHFANRFAGAVPNEAMSEVARKALNVILFSRSFTTGNLGVMKDMLNGLPRDVRAQLGRNLEPLERKAATSIARRKAIGTVLADVALMYASNAILQSAFNTLSGDRDLGAEGKAYVDRVQEMLKRGEENPLSLINPLSDLEELMPTAENEPQRGDRIKIGHAADGTAIYLRSPVGKIGEEFSGWVTKPLQMLKNKEGTIARPVLNTINNDRGLGQKVYTSNPHGIADVASNIGSVVWEFMRSQTPEIQLKAGMKLVTGKGDWVDALQFVAPFLGGTISRGAPGGEQVGELYQARGEHEEKVKAALPEIRQLVKDGKTEEAEKRLGELKMPRQLQRYYMKVFSNPGARLSPRAMKDFERYATPEQKRRMEMQRNQRDLRQGTGTP